MLVHNVTELESEIADKGYAVLPFPAIEHKDEILQSLGEIIQVTEIREKQGSSRLLVSNQPMDFHTDHFAANYIAWQCNSQSATGGESLLIDAQPIIASFSDSVKELLREVNVNSHKVLWGDKLSYPLLSPTDDEHTFAHSIPSINKTRKSHATIPSEPE